MYLTYVSRMSGGLPPKLPWKLDQVLFGLPYGLLAWLAGAEWPYILAAFLCATIVKITGHGQWMTLPFSVKAIEPERLDFLLLPFFGQDPRTKSEFKKWRGTWPKKGTEYFTKISNAIAGYGTTRLYIRNIFGLMVNGMCLAVGTTIAFAVAEYTYCAAAFFIIHALIPFGYVVGWKWLNNIEPPDFLNTGEDGGNATEWGEIGRGAVCDIACIVALVWLLI